MSSVLETIGPRSASAPYTYTLTELGTVDLMAVFASYDGSAAAAFLPVVTVRAQNGAILARGFPGSTVAAGDSADVTFAPFLRGAEASDGHVIEDEGTPLAQRANLNFVGAGVVASDDPGNDATLVTVSSGGGRTLVSRTEITSDVTITGTTDGGATTVITAPAFTPDGVSTYAFTIFTPNAATGSSGALLANLFQDGVSIGRMWGFSPPAATSMSVPIMATYFFVPTSSSHTYSWRSWRVTNNGTITAGSGGATSYLPAYLLIEKL